MIMVLNNPLTFFGKRSFPSDSDGVLATLTKKLPRKHIFSIDKHCYNSLKTSWMKALKNIK
jgi:hypothetical protein